MHHRCAAMYKHKTTNACPEFRGSCSGFNCGVFRGKAFEKASISGEREKTRENDDLDDQGLPRITRRRYVRHSCVRPRRPYEPVALCSEYLTKGELAHEY